MSQFSWKCQFSNRIQKKKSLFSKQKELLFNFYIILYPITMSHIQYTDSRPAVEMKVIKLYEEKLNCKFPEEYKNFLLLHNGGIPDPCSFAPIGHTDPMEAVDYFTSIGGENYEDIIQVQLSTHNLYQDACLNPLDYVVIAVDAFMNRILLSVGPRNYGHIYFLSYEHEDFSAYPCLYNRDENCASCRFMYHVATSFDNWLNSFMYSGEYEEDENNESVASLTAEDLADLKAHGIDLDAYNKENYGQYFFDSDEENI